MKSHVFSGTLALLICAHSFGAAQGTQNGQPTRSVAGALERFEQDASASQPVSPVGWSGLLRIVSQCEPSRRAAVDSVLNGVEHLALNASNERVRSRAATFLRAAGRAISDPRSHPILPRLLHIYRTSSDPVVRSVVIDGMVWERSQFDEAVAFLRQVATSTPGTTNPDFADEPWAAVSALSHMGAPGMTALRDLRTSAVVQDWKAKGYLEYMARRGFRPDE